jgi:hypothetical protein
MANASVTYCSAMGTNAAMAKATAERASIILWPSAKLVNPISGDDQADVSVPQIRHCDLREFANMKFLTSVRGRTLKKLVRVASIDAPA